MNTRLAGLGVLAVLLGGYLAVEELGLFQSAEPVQVASPAATPAASAAMKLNPLQGLDPANYPAIVEKPLFNPSRRPPPAESAPPPPAEQPVAEEPPPPPAPAGPGPEDYKLLGVSAGPDGRIAVLRIAASDDVVYLRQGETIDSWTVIDIGDRSVEIGTPENPVTFSMFAASGEGDTEGDQAVPEDGAQPPQQPPLPLPVPVPPPSPSNGEPAQQ